MNEKQRAQGPADGSEITLGSVVRALLGKFYWLLLAGLIAGAAVYLAVTLLVTPTYESRVSFYVYNSAANTTQSGTINNSDLQAAESLATTYSKILASNSVLDAVLEDLSGSGLSRKELSGMVKVSVVSNTQLLEVVITSTDPAFACRVADAFARVAPTEIVRITKAGGVEVVDRPEVPTEKTAPRTLFDSAIGFVVGALAAAIWIVLRMMSDTTIYLPEDVEKMTGVTVLGQIPEIDPEDGKEFQWALTQGGAVRNEGKENRQSGE